MSLCDLITADRVVVAARIGEPAELIDMIAGLLAPGSGLEPAEVASALREREKLGSTAIGRGVALPHARHPELLATVAALIVLSQPLDMESPDGEPVDIAIGILTPHEASDLPKLSALVKRLRNPELTDELRAATAPAQAVAALRMHAVPPAGTI